MIFSMGVSFYPFVLHSPGPGCGGPKSSGIVSGAPSVNIRITNVRIGVRSLNICGFSLSFGFVLLEIDFGDYK